MGLLNTCDECYHVELPACPDDIFIYTDSFSAEEDFYVEVIDKFGNRYWGDPANAGYGGVIRISISAIVEHGLLNEYSGVWEMRFYTDADCSELKELVFCDEVYECISMEFYKLRVGEREAIICCEPPIPYP